MFILYIILLYFSSFFFLGPHLWHMEVLMPGVESDPYTTTTATWNRGVSTAHTTAHHNTRSLTHWVRPGIKSASSWILVEFINHLAMMGTPILYISYIYYTHTQTHTYTHIYMVREIYYKKLDHLQVSQWCKSPRESWCSHSKAFRKSQYCRWSKVYHWRVLTDSREGWSFCSIQTFNY